MDKKVKMTPELRFREFSGEWEKSFLYELLEESKKRNYENKYAKNDVFSVSGNYGIVNQIEFQGRSFAGSSVLNYHVVEPGDVVYTKSPLKSNPYGIIKYNPKISGIVSTLYAVYKPKDALASQFLDYYFQLDDNVNKYLRPLVNKGAKNDMKIKNQHVLNGFIYISTKDEQKKIAGFLGIVDDKISDLEKKKELLEKYKKGVMQKIFTQQLRFKGFSGKREEKSLGSIISIVKGTQLNGDELIEEGKFPMLNGGIYPSGYTNDFNTQADTITISEGGNSCGHVSFMKESFWSGGHCYTLQNLSSGTNKFFLYQLLKFNQAKIMRLRVGSGLPNIQKKDLQKLHLFMPEPEEQKKIADFLTAIDDKIELQNKKLQQAKLFKKSLLQRMLV